MTGGKAFGKEVRIGGATVGAGSPTYIVAEAGVNHNGDLAIAMALVEAAAAAGADAVKFQAFSAERLVTDGASTAAYQPGSSQRDMLMQLELHPEDFAAIASGCGAAGVELLLTPFGPEDVELLVDLGAHAIKVASPDVTNHPLLEVVGRTHLPVILSTGAADTDEIAAAIDALACAGTDQLILLQCVSSYPTPIDEANLNCIGTLAEKFGVPVGYSDHTMELITGELAVGVGACLLEKHFTLDPTMHGPDHAFSLRPVELTAYIVRARSATCGVLDPAGLGLSERAALGNGVKRLGDIEKDVRDVARSSVTSAEAIAAGATVTAAMLTIKRPGGGIPPSEIASVVGRVAAVDIPADTTLTPDMFE